MKKRYSLRMVMLLGIAALFTLQIVFATSPSNVTILLNYSDQPVNGSQIINITGTEYSTISLNYWNVTSNSTDMNATFVSGPDSIDIGVNQTWGTYVFSWDVDEINIGDYSQVVTLNKVNSTENLTFNFEVLDDSPPIQIYNYTGNCIFLNAYPTTIITIAINNSDTPYDNTTCFAIYNEENVTLSVLAEDWLILPEIVTIVGDVVKEFDVKLHIPPIQTTVASKSYERSVALFNSSMSKIIKYDITLYNPDYLEIDDDNDTDDDLNYTILQTLDNLTASELLALIQDYSDLANASRPKYIVQVKNSTEYVNVPVSAEFFEQIWANYDPAKVAALEKENKDLKRDFGAEESESEFNKGAYEDAKAETETLKEEIESVQLEKEEALARTKTKIKQIIYIILFAIIGLILIFFIISRIRILNAHNW